LVSLPTPIIGKIGATFPAPPVIGNSAFWEYNHDMIAQYKNKVKIIMQKTYALDKKHHFIISLSKVMIIKAKR